MEQLTHSPSFQFKDESFIESDKVKTSLRMTYEAQSEVIRKQIGELENVREKLGLSARKISQLLMVDPSAWTRWTRKGDPVPPHIWRALQWYMTLNEKIPGLTPQYFIGRDPMVIREQGLAQIKELQSHFDEKYRSLQNENDRLTKKLRNLESAVRANRIGFIMMGISALVLAFAFFRLLHSN